MISETLMFWVPGLPLDQVVDPTGAGIHSPEVL